MTFDPAELWAAAESAAAAATSADQLRQSLARFTGKKGAVTEALKGLKDLDPESRKRRGAELNELRQRIEALQQDALARLAQGARAAAPARDRLDATLPGRHAHVGSLHPITATARRILTALEAMGFTTAEGPEVEEQYYNFDALNFPPDHPAKEMQDTFFLADAHRDQRGVPLILRTHTSPVQIRAMARQAPPLKVAAYGKVYRVDADATHSPMFHQIEGFWVDDRVTFRDLKGVLAELLGAVFGARVAVRLRPSYFPFVEPGAEVDVSCVFCAGAGCRVCSQSGWLELAGAGMIHRNVLAEGFRDRGIATRAWQGFAFGLGIERFAMLAYGIPDIRLLYESDVRFLAQTDDRRLP